MSLTAVTMGGGGGEKAVLLTGFKSVFSWCTVHVNLDVCILHISSADFVRLLNKLLLLSY